MRGDTMKNTNVKTPFAPFAPLLNLKKQCSTRFKRGFFSKGCFETLCTPFAKFGYDYE